MTDNKPDDKEMEPSIKMVKKYFKDNNISINIKPKSDTFSSRWYRHSFAVGVESDYCVLKQIHNVYTFSFNR